MENVFDIIVTDIVPERWTTYKHIDWKDRKASEAGGFIATVNFPNDVAVGKIYTVTCSLARVISVIEKKRGVIK